MYEEENKKSDYCWPDQYSDGGEDNQLPEDFKVEHDEDDVHIANKMLQSYDEELIKEIQDATGVERQLVIIALTYNKGDANKVMIEFVDDFGKSF